MRRISRVLTGVAGGLVIVGGLVAAQALPASAASGKLFVTTVGRNGQAVASPITVMNSARSYSGLPIWTSSGRTLKLADGHYYVLAGIQDPAIDTLAAGYVTVSGTGTTKVTLDARKGRLIKATLNGKTLTDYINATICVDGGFANEDVGGTPGSVYAVPSKLGGVNFAYLAQGQGATVSGHTASGIPSSPGGAWTASHLAKVSLTVRAGEAPGTSITSDLQPATPNGSNSCQDYLNGSVEQAAAPYSYTELVSPGYWDVRTDDSMGGYDVMRHVFAGHSYSYAYYKAAWGVGAPSMGGLPFVEHSAISLIAPAISDPDGNGGLYGGALSAVALSLNGHQIAKGTTRSGVTAGEFKAHIKSAGWYTLAGTVTRDYSSTVPGGLLSPKVTLAWRFYATPAEWETVPAFYSTFAPGALNAMNQARPGKATIVKVTPTRSPNPNAPVTAADSVTKLQVWWSADGVHWKALAVTRTSGGYFVTVPGLASGNVDLRSKITGSRGDTSTETVYKAYAIS